MYKEQIKGLITHVDLSSFKKQIQQDQDLESMAGDELMTVMFDKLYREQGNGISLNKIIKQSTSIP
jgi:hypothetical protein